MARSGIDTSALDPDVRPQDDLYQHVNGRWIASHEIPADRAMDGAFRALHDRAEEQVRTIIEDAAARTAGPDASGGRGRRTAVARASRRRSARSTRASWTPRRVEKLGTAPLDVDLALIAAPTTPGGAHRRARGAPAQRRRRRPWASGWTTTPRSRRATSCTSTSPASACRTSRTTARSGTRPSARRTCRTSRACCALAGVVARRGTPTTPPARVLALETRLAAGHWDVVARPRRRPHLQPDDPGRPRRAGAGLRLARVGARARRARGRRWTGSSCASRPTPRRFADPVEQRAARGLEGLARAAGRRRARAVPVRRARRGELRLLRPHAHRRAGAARPLEARRRARRGRRSARRSARCTSSGTSRRRTRQRMERLVENLVEAYRESITALDWMGEEHQGQGAGQARRVHAEDRLPGQVARLLRRSSVDAGRPGRQRAPRVGVRAGPRAGQDRQADRPRRVVHDAADGQRLLQPRDERDRLPRRDPAAAVLRRRGRRRRQLRRHRRA